MTLPLPSSPHWPPTRMMTTGLRGARLGPPGLQVVEAGVVAAELELDHAGRAIAVLGDDHLGYAWLLVRLIVLGPVKKYDNVTILFDRVVSHNISSNEVVQTLYRQVIDVVSSGWRNRLDLFPLDVAYREQFELVTANCLCNAQRSDRK